MFSRKKAAAPRPICPNVLTPDKIPRFFIPPNLATLQGRRLCRSLSPGAEGLVPDPSSSQQGSQTGGQPHSASSMPQLSSPAGLPLLPESPHTRRRESLFHTGRAPRRCPFARLCAPPARPLLRHGGAAADSDTPPSSTETSPYSSPLLARSPGSPPLGQGCRPCRRSAGRGADLSPAPRPSSLSMEETSSTDTSPSFPRRVGKEPSWSGPATPSPPPLSPVFPLDLIRCRERIAKELVLTVRQGGRLRLSSEYLQAQGCLRVRVVSAEGFYPARCDPRHIHCGVSLRLRPGRGPCQRSAVVKKSRNPIFNEDFFFEGVSPEELPRLSLRLKVLNKGSAMRRDSLLGECDVPLDSLLP